MYVGVPLKRSTRNNNGKTDTPLCEFLTFTERLHQTPFKIRFLVACEGTEIVRDLVAY